MKKRFALLLAAVMVLCMAAGCGSGNAPDSAGGETDGTYTATWKFAHNESERGTMQMYAEKFKELVEEKSEGNITVQIYPDGTLGAGDSIIELLQGGGLEFALADSGYIGSFVPESQIFRAHFLLTDDKEMNRKLLTGEAIELLNQKFQDNQMTVMQHAQAGAVYWTGNKAFRTIDDFKGVKMRTVPTPVLIEIYKAYGAEPTAVNYSELYSALQLGTADAQENPINTVNELTLDDVQSTLTLSGHYVFIDTCVTNSSFYNSLPEDVKAMLSEVFDDLGDYIEDAIEEYESGILDDLEKDAKMEIVRLTDEEKNAFRGFNEENRELLRESLGESGMEILLKLEQEKNALLK